MRGELQITEIQGALKEALKKLVNEIHLGLEHGFFEYRIVCELAKKWKAHVHDPSRAQLPVYDL